MVIACGFWGLENFPTSFREQYGMTLCGNCKTTRMIKKECTLQALVSVFNFHWLLSSFDFFWIENWVEGAKSLWEMGMNQTYGDSWWTGKPWTTNHHKPLDKQTIQWIVFLVCVWRRGAYCSCCIHLLLPPPWACGQTQQASSWQQEQVGRQRGHWEWAGGQPIMPKRFVLQWYPWTESQTKLWTSPVCWFFCFVVWFWPSLIFALEVVLPWQKSFLLTFLTT